jgi:hypothetical protein
MIYFRGPDADLNPKHQILQLAWLITCGHHRRLIPAPHLIPGARRFSLSLLDTATGFNYRFSRYLYNRSKWYLIQSAES